MKSLVYLPEPVAQSAWDILEPSCECIAPWKDDQKISEAEMEDLLKKSDAVMVRLFSVSKERIENSPKLKVIAKHGVGVDNIDVAAATARRIQVVFTPSANANAVAEHTMALMLALARNIFPTSAALLAGRWADRMKFDGVELAGKILAVAGLGRIGRRVAEIAQQGFGMNVKAYDPFFPKGVDTGKIRMESSIDALFQSADFITLHLPLTEDTRFLLNAERLNGLKPECRIVNTSRGGVIDEAALAFALQDGRLAGAALDVFEKEPLPEGHPFFSSPRLLLTPHISSSTRESLARMASDAAQGILDVLQGRKPAWPVNPEACA